MVQIKMFKAKMFTVNVVIFTGEQNSQKCWEDLSLWE